jgi:hypothetical protein
MDHFLKEVIVLLTRIAVAVEGGTVAPEKPKATPKAIPKAIPKATPKAKATKAVAPVDSAATTAPTVEELTAATREAVSIDGPAVRVVLDEFKAARVGELKVEQYPAYLAAMKGIITPKDAAEEFV